jgi:hypothetical protein
MKVAVLAALSVLSLFRQKLDSVSGKIMFRQPSLRRTSERKPHRVVDALCLGSKAILTLSSASARARILSIFRKCGAGFAGAQIFPTCASTIYDIPTLRSRWLPASACS